MYEHVVVMHDSNPAVFMIFLAVLLVVHFVPSFVAFSRDHASKVLILILNIIMGWTVIGWALLLFWAYNGQKRGLLS